MKTKRLYLSASQQIIAAKSLQKRYKSQNSDDFSSREEEYIYIYKFINVESGVVCLEMPRVFLLKETSFTNIQRICFCDEYFQINI